jgi:hypothetical protein
MFCECGCGRKTRIVGGTPNRFIAGHNAHPRKSLAEVLANKHEVRDLGYDTPCWMWTGRLHPQGYGYTAYHQKTLRAHRGMYMLHVGPIPDGMELDHLCRNRGCVNPEHLEPVTREENSRRGAGTKLCPGEVIAIRMGTESQSAAAEKFGVSCGTIGLIRTGARWKFTEAEQAEAVRQYHEIFDPLPQSAQLEGV